MAESEVAMRAMTMTEVKTGWTGVFLGLPREGVIAIQRHKHTVAYLVSPDEYERLCRLRVASPVAHDGPVADTDNAELPAGWVEQEIPPEVVARVEADRASGYGESAKKPSRRSTLKRPAARPVPAFQEPAPLVVEAPCEFALGVPSEPWPPVADAVPLSVLGPSELAGEGEAEAVAASSPSESAQEAAVRFIQEKKAHHEKTKAWERDPLRNPHPGAAPVMGTTVPDAQLSEEERAAIERARRENEILAAKRSEAAQAKARLNMQVDADISMRFLFGESAIRRWQPVPDPALVDLRKAATAPVTQETKDKSDGYLKYHAFRMRYDEMRRFLSESDELIPRSYVALCDLPPWICTQLPDHAQSLIATFTTPGISVPEECPVRSEAAE